MYNTVKDRVLFFLYVIIYPYINQILISDWMFKNPEFSQKQQCTRRLATRQRY